MDDKPIKSNRVRRRPWGVTLLAFGILIYGLLYLTRFYQAIRDWEFLRELLPFSPLYLVISGFLWGIIGLSLFWGLWRGKSWAPKCSLFSILLFLGYYWSDRLLMPHYSGRNENTLFCLGASLFVCAYGVFVLRMYKAKLFFGDHNE
jgi:hypothetical protein